MSPLEAECVNGAAGSRELPGAANAVGELESRARIGACPSRDVPLVGHGNCFREGQRHGPAAERGGAAVGYRYIYLERISRLGRCCSTGMGGEYLTGPQAGQQYS